MFRWLLPLLCLALAPSPSHAWGRLGHQIVCAVAWDDFDAPARARVKTILAVENREQFAALCNWADDYRRDHDETADWHFLNVAPAATSVDLRQDCTEPKSCAVEQVHREIADLRHGIADKEQEAMTLKFLIHFVGDVHQPLHISFAHDKGGNDIKGSFLWRDTNLHSVWDTGMIIATGHDWRDIAARLSRGVTPAQRAQWPTSTPLAWANESLAITLAPSTRYVTHDTPFDLGVVYARKELPIIMERMTQAGVRLAHVINGLWGDR